MQKGLKASRYLRALTSRCNIWILAIVQYGFGTLDKCTVYGWPHLEILEVYRLIDSYPLDALVLALTIIVLGYAAVCDLKTREVSDWVWMYFLPASIILLILRLLLRPDLIVVSVISVAASASISFLMSYVGLFGGADFKAFTCLGLALPTNPFMTKTLLPSINPLFPITVFYNTYLLSTCVLFYCLAKNIYWKYRLGRRLFRDPTETALLRRVLAIFTGYKTSFTDLQTKSYLYPMEEVIENGETHRRLKLFVNVEEDRNSGIESLRESLSGSETDEVWVTPGIPLLLFAFLALLQSVLLGDLLFWIVSRIMSAIA